MMSPKLELPKQLTSDHTHQISAKLLAKHHKNCKGCPVVLATFKNFPAERVPSECSQFRYIYDIFKKDIFFYLVPINCRYIADMSQM